jgi:hypothetical protein
MLAEPFWRSDSGMTVRLAFHFEIFAKHDDSANRYRQNKLQSQQDFGSSAIWK